MDGKLLVDLKRYGVAVALPGLALTLRGVLPFPEGAGIYQLPLAAVVLSAWYGGRGPGWLASLISVMGAMYLLPPGGSFNVSPDHWLPLSIFIALCLLLAEFSAGRRRVEHSLGASEERFRTLVQFSFDGYWETDAQHRFTRQEYMQDLPDAPKPGSETGKTRWELPYLEPDEEAWRKYRATLDAHLPFRDFEIARPASDNRKRYVSVSGLPMFDETGRFIGYRGVGRDISERKRAEQELRAGEERFRTLVQFSFDVYWETDAQHRFTRQEFTEGLADAPARGSEIGKTRWEVPYLEPDEEAWRKHRETLDAHLPFRDFEVARPHPDGGKRYVSTSGLPMFDERGRFTGYRGVGRHITERKRAEQELQRTHLQLVHMSRVMTTAELATSIAHEVNQPLGSILAD